MTTRYAAARDVGTAEVRDLRARAWQAELDAWSAALAPLLQRIVESDGELMTGRQVFRLE
jgi:hypothetical protein